MSYTITVLGLGFVGLTTALGLAEKGNRVYGYDVNRDRLATLKNGNIPFMEPTLEEMLNKHHGNNLTINDGLEEAISLSDFIFICVGTPTGDDGGVDLTYIFNALNTTFKALSDERHRIIVIKSTVPPATTKSKITPFIKELNNAGRYSYSVVNNPEFLREGKCWEDFMYADRIICGVEDRLAEDKMRDLYSSFEAPFIPVSLNTAEFIKYLSNTMLASMISFSNEMSIIADFVGDIDVKDAFRILHMDKRWQDTSMKSYVYPGCGYGGYCLPKDTKALLKHSSQFGYEPQLLKNVITINETMAEYVVSKLAKQIDKGKRLAILGLSFKPDSDDTRESPAGRIIHSLYLKGYKNICAYDPIASQNFLAEYSYDYVSYCSSLEEACGGADAIIVVTAWKEFGGLEERYPGKEIFDLRYFL